jgi:hypothetical protein
MSERAATGGWIPLMDYSLKKGLSLSTLRRYIKANKVKFRIENGRYLLFDDDWDNNNNAKIEPLKNAQSKLHTLQVGLQKAHEEIAELKMLIALYEEKMGSPQTLNSLELLTKPIP